MTLDDLKQYQKLLQRREELLEAIEESANTLKGVPVGSGRVIGGSRSDPVAVAAAKREKLAAAVADIEERMKAIEIFINDIRADPFGGYVGEVLEWHYIGGVSWVEMGRTLHEKPDTLRVMCRRYIGKYSEEKL